MKTNTYLHFNGNCEEAMDFYADILGGEITMKMRFEDAPENVFEAPEFALKWIMHSTLEASGITILASDYLSPTEKLKVGNNFAISISTTDENEAVAIFNGLSSGEGYVKMPLEEAFWGGKFGMVIDKYGVSWMLSLDDGSSMV